MNHVFVDFENVPNVDLSLIRDQPVDVALLIGQKQRRLDLDLVRQIHAHASKVELIEVGASGRNALDLVLAWQLGKAAERCPKDSFFVVSKDKDFDPLIRHLRSRDLQVARVDSFSSLPFLGAPEPERRKNVIRRASAPEQAVAQPAVKEPKTKDDPHLAKLVDRLLHKPKARPVSRKKLLSHINGFYGKRLSPPELEGIAGVLEKQGVIAIDNNGKVSYPQG